MLNIKKVKTRVRRETDKYLKENKDKMICFYEESVRKKEGAFSRKNTAVAICTLLVLCIVIFSVVFHFSSPFKETTPVVSPYEQPKLKKIDDALLYNPYYVIASHLMEVSLYPDVDFNNITKLPVYIASQRYDCSELANSAIEHFNIKGIVLNKVRNYSFNNNVTVSLISSEYNNNNYNHVEAYDMGLLKITVRCNIEDKDFAFEIPTDNDENAQQYMKDYIKEHKEFFNIEAPEITMIGSYKNDAPFRYLSTVLVTDNPLVTDYDKVLNFNFLSKRIIFDLSITEKSQNIKIVAGNYDKFNRIEEDYDIISQDEAFALIKSGKGKLYEGDHDPSNMNVSEDNFVQTYIFYAFDNNGYYRPIYVFLMETSNKKTYSMWVDAIDSKHIE